MGLLLEPWPEGRYLSRIWVYNVKIVTRIGTSIGAAVPEAHPVSSIARQITASPTFSLLPLSVDALFRQHLGRRSCYFWFRILMAYCRSSRRLIELSSYSQEVIGLPLN